MIAFLFNIMRTVHYSFIFELNELFTDLKVKEIICNQYCLILKQQRDLG